MSRHSVALDFPQSAICPMKYNVPDCEFLWSFMLERDMKADGAFLVESWWKHPMNSSRTLGLISLAVLRAVPGHKIHPSSLMSICMLNHKFHTSQLFYPNHLTQHISYISLIFTSDLIHTIIPVATRKNALEPLFKRFPLGDMKAVILRILSYVLLNIAAEVALGTVILFRLGFWSEV